MYDIAAHHRYEEIEKTGPMTDMGPLRSCGAVDAAGVVVVPSVLQPMQQLERVTVVRLRSGAMPNQFSGYERAPEKGQGVDQCEQRELPGLGSLGDRPGTLRIINEVGSISNSCGVAVLLACDSRYC
jgi:hypothetical protein